MSLGSRQKQKRDSTHGHHQMVNTEIRFDYILCSQRWRSSVQSAKTRPGANCGLDHELLMAKLRLKLKNIGKTTTPFRYNLNQIPYDYTVEVRNRFKGLDLVDRVPDELEKVSFHSNSKERQCQRMLKLPHNCTHLTH